ncbi:hypothetical protein LUZ28_29860, partial [Streptomyces albireticuli]
MGFTAISLLSAVGACSPWIELPEGSGGGGEAGVGGDAALGGVVLFVGLAVEGGWLAVVAAASLAVSLLAGGDRDHRL